MVEEILKIVKLQEERLKRRKEELELRKGKSFEESVKEVNTSSDTEAKNK